MPKIFISYRREDSQYQADRLHAALKKHVPNAKRDIFIDVDNIPVGVDFVDHLDSRVAQCDVLLAVIGPGWLNAGATLLSGRRLDDPKDFVRVEIASALKRGIQVAPILLDGTPMPKEDQLPPDLKPLARRNGVEIRRLTFDDDIERMIKGLRIAAAEEKPRPSWLAPAAAACAALIIGTAIWQFGPFGRKAEPTSAEMIDALKALDASRVTDILKRGWNPDSSLNSESNASLHTLLEACQNNPGHDRAAMVKVAEVLVAAGATLDLKNRWKDTPLTIAVSPRYCGPEHPVTKYLESVAAPAKAGTFIPGQPVHDCVGCPDMVAIPPGSLMMGSPASEAGRGADEGPQRRVTISYQLLVGKSEVTVAQYLECVSALACRPPEWREAGGKRNATAKDSYYSSFTASDQPVVGVDWSDARAYAVWLAGKTGKPYRLLSESEWEYAARAGSTTAYPWSESPNNTYANYGKDQWKTTTKAGTFFASAYGLDDMIGNVWEWVEDCYSDSYSAGQPSNGNAFTPAACAERVSRGGSWDDNPQAVRSATRARNKPDLRTNVLGFRVARTG